MRPVGVLALQGDWATHAKVLGEIGAHVRTVRTEEELDEIGALVIPGGESTAMLRLMEADNLAGRIVERVTAGMAVLATCAGVIVLARDVFPQQESLGLLAVDIERNAYGRQLHSTVAEIELAPPLGEPRRMEGVFIRAPRIARHAEDVDVLATWGEDPVLVRQNRIVAATFHPELTNDRRVHQLFVQIGEEANG